MAGFLTACILIGMYDHFFDRIFTDRKQEQAVKRKQYIAYTLKADTEKGMVVTEDMLASHRISVDEDDNIQFTDKQEILGKELKNDVKGGMLINESMIQIGESIQDSLRLQMYAGIELNPEILEGEMIDIRIQFADGEDYVVATHKKVEKRGEDYIVVFVDEEEILRLSSAETDRRMFEGTRMYAILYADREQLPAKVDYPVNSYVAELYDWTPNILDQICTEDSLQRRQLLEENLRQLVR